MKSEKVKVLPHELIFYCGNKENCNRQYTCIIPSKGVPNVCEHLIAKSDREVYDSIDLLHKNEDVKE